MSGDLDPASLPPSPARGIAGQVVANTSLLVAVLVYMGWAYEDALYGYFHLSPLSLDVNLVEYMLRSLRLFSPDLVIAAAVIAALAAVRAWDLGRTRFMALAADRAMARISAVPGVRGLVPAADAGQPRTGRLVLITAGSAVTAAALVLALSASHIPVSTYVVLALLGGGPLLLTWPTRDQRHGRFPYSLALVVAAVCALWAASLYAHNLAIQSAQIFVRNLSSQTAVVVYSVQPLDLSGPGVTVQQFQGPLLYHYRYQGLRLLTIRSGKYYLLPIGWSPQVDLTYIFNESDPVRIELLSGVVRTNS